MARLHHPLRHLLTNKKGAPQTGERPFSIRRESRQILEPNSQTRSIMIAGAMPPAAHIVTSP